jgi:hypothetical protein
MTQYLLSVVQPTGDGTLPPDLDQIMADVDEVDRQMHEAGVWVFAGGLHDPKTATDLDAALEWGTRLARATRLPIEVRPFQ